MTLRRRRGHRYAGRHRLEDHLAERLRHHRRVHEDVEPLELGSHVRAKAPKLHAVGDAQLLGQLAQLGLVGLLPEQRRAHDGGLDRSLGEGPGERLEEDVLTLPRRQPADHAHALHVVATVTRRRRTDRIGNHHGASARGLRHGGQGRLGVGHQRRGQGADRSLHERHGATGQVVVRQPIVQVPYHRHPRHPGRDRAVQPALQRVGVHQVGLKRMEAPGQARDVERCARSRWMQLISPSSAFRWPVALEWS
jgi:hypothetical protein